MPTTTTTTTPYENMNGSVQVVPGAVDTGSTNQIGITDLGGQLAADPNVLFNDDMNLSSNLPNITNQQVQDASQQAAPTAGTTPTAQAGTGATQQAAGATGNTQASQVQTATTQPDIAADHQRGQYA